MPLVGHQHQIDILEPDRQGGMARVACRSPLFVEGLLPGEQALVELTEVKPELPARQAGRADQPLRRSGGRFCPNTECGGCQVRLLAHPAQLALKQSPGAERTGAGRSG